MIILFYKPQSLGNNNFKEALFDLIDLYQEIDKIRGAGGITLFL
jgi:hypothetical protein